MDAYVKLQSVQGGEITNTQNLLDFRIPAGDVYDLHDSFIALNGNVETVDSSQVGGDAVYPVNLQWVTADAEKPHFQNVAVVKNCNMDCAAKGRIENIRAVGVLRQNLATYIDSQKEQLNQSYIDINQLEQPIAKEVYGQFSSFNKVGSVKSAPQTIAPIQIRLSDLMEFCRAREYDTRRAGDTRIHLELNRDKLEAVQVMKNASIPLGLRIFKNETTQGYIGNTITLGQNNTTNVNKVSDLNQMPYYVGQRLLVSATGVGGIGSVVNSPVVISSIAWDRATGAYSLTFSTNWGGTLGAGESYTQIRVIIADATSVTYKMNSAELVLRRVQNPQNVNQINYNTYSTEQVNGNGQQSYTNLFTVEGEASNVVLMFPDGNDGLISNNNDISSWRLRLNNNDLTDRDVDKDSPLAYDRLALTLNNMGYSLKNLNKNAGKSNAQAWTGTYTDTKFNTQLILNPLFQTPNTKLLQVNINAGGGGVKAVNLYKQLPRVFSY